MALSIPASGRRRRALDRLPEGLRGGATTAAAVVVVLLVLIALLAPLLAPYRPDAQDLTTGVRLQGPSHEHWLGTDDLGRDVLSRLIYGARVSLSVVVVVEAIELLFGAGLGLMAGYYGGLLDTVVMRLADTMFAFPDILLAILITGILGKSIGFVFLALALVGWPAMVRLVRGQVLSLREQEYVQATRALGASDRRILVRHLLPNVVGPVIVQVTVGAAGVILAEATLSFLGLGVQPPAPSWGSMVQRSWEYHRAQPLQPLWPALTLATAITALNFLGDGLRDWLDPRLRSL
jgi:ABC-type dipeptide/oligopeptide/nickel transport system permease subunit